MFEGMDVSHVPGWRDYDMTARDRIQITKYNKVLFDARS